MNVIEILKSATEAERQEYLAALTPIHRALVKACLESRTDLHVSESVPEGSGRFSSHYRPGED